MSSIALQNLNKEQLAALATNFTKAQGKDVLKLWEDCSKAPLRRIRKARVRNVDPNHVGRPINSFMAYRSVKQRQIRVVCPKANHRVISQIIAKWWKDIDEEEKNIYIRLADTAKKEHALKHPNYVFKPKKGTKQAAKKTTFVNNSNSATGPHHEYLEYHDDQIYHQSSPHFTTMGDKVIYEYQQYRLPYGDAPTDRNAASDYYYQSLVNYAPLPLDDGDASHGRDMYVNPALLSNSYNMDINSAEPIHFDDDNESALFAMLSNTPASQIMETPTLDYYTSPMSYPQSSFHQQHDTPHLLDHTIIPSDYTNEYGKLFDTLGNPDIASPVASDMVHCTSFSAPHQHTPQTDDYSNFIYGNSASANLIFADQHPHW